MSTKQKKKKMQGHWFIYNGKTVPTNRLVAMLSQDQTVLIWRLIFVNSPSKAAVQPVKYGRITVKKHCMKIATVGVF